MKNLDSLEKALGTHWVNPSLLEEALTHSSYVNENPGLISNERLEFLGDAVLGATLAQKLYMEYPDLEEGELTRRRSLLARGSTLARVAKSVGLGDYLYMGRGEEASGGRSKATNLAGALEAVVAAAFMDRGWDAVRDFILRLFGAEIEKMRQELDIDYKSQLQLQVQSQYKITPSYRIVDASGLDHERQFTAEAMIGDEVLSQGSGRSKKLAEAAAARMALEKWRDVFTDQT